MNARTLFIAGLVLVILGLALLFVPIPRRERHAIDAGPVSFRVETSSRELVPRPISATVIGGGIVLIVVASRRKR